MDEAVYQQISNVATYGIARYALCMPDGHSGYGFPLAALQRWTARRRRDIARGIGFDINCGMRLITTNLTWKCTTALEEMSIVFSTRAAALALTIPQLSHNEFETCGTRRALVRRARSGWQKSRVTEEAVASQAPTIENQRARSRARLQPGRHSRSGNHYLEVQVAERGRARQGAREKFGIRFRTRSW